ncbi:MAG: DUF2062 domain-containing protein [Desulfomonilia bacterium]|nr:DUF2062 domain-containing protein [Desulfomonilia bacterium]
MWLKKWREKEHELRERLRDTHAYRILGEKIFASALWKIDKRSISGGLALGLFVALTPTIPFQMLLVTFGALYWKVNLPIALAACWITNPVTAIPIYGAAMNFGNTVVHTVPCLRDIIDMYTVEAKPARFLQQTLYLWIGSLIFSSGAAICAHVVVRLFWNAIYRFFHRKRPATKNGRFKKKNRG